MFSFFLRGRPALSRLFARVYDGVCLEQVNSAPTQRPAPADYATSATRRRNEDVRLSFLGLFSFHAPFLPYVLVGFSVLLGAPLARFHGVYSCHLSFSSRQFTCCGPDGDCCWSRLLLS